MRFPLFFFALAGLCGYALSLTSGPARWLWLWPALSAGVFGLAYAGLGPRAIGKGPSGRQHPALRLLHLPTLALLGGIWHLQRLLGREPAVDEVAPGVWVGRWLYPSELPPECGLVVDLTCEFAPHTGVLARCDYLTLPTLDGTPPSPAQLAQVQELRDHPGGILFHCAQGHGRSATCAAVLMIARGLAGDVEEAEATMRAARPGVRLKPVQRQAVAALAGERGGSGAGG